MTRTLAALGSLAMLYAVGCGIPPNADVGSAEGGSGVASSPAARPAASAPGTVTAAQPSGSSGEEPASRLPQVVTQGGRVLAHPKVVLISFPGDTFAPTLEPFVEELAASSFWSTTTSEYGVGALTVTAPVRLQKGAPPSLSDAQIQSILTTALENPANAFGPPDPETIYTLLVPLGTPDTGPNGASACGGGFAGYHASFALDDGTVIPYAVIVECSPSLPGSRTLAHELVETATDPFRSAPAYNAVGPADLGYRIARGSEGTEVGDMCEDAGPATVPGVVEKVARIWSDAAARVGKNPCLPVPAGETFSLAVPSAAPETIAATLPSGSTLAGAGFLLSQGQSRTIDLELVGDATEPAAISAHAVDEASAALTFALDKPSGTKGDHLKLTITAVGDTSIGVPFALDAVLAGVTRTWFGIVSSSATRTK